MADITATKRIDPDNGFVETITEDRGAWSGERHYLVNTDLPELAMKAIGLPVRGDAWSTDYPTLQVVKRGPLVRLGGIQQSGDGDGPISRVPIYYATPGASSFVPGSTDDSYTEIELASGSLTLYHPLQRLLRDFPGSEGNPAEPTWGGDGASVPAPSITARVHTFYSVQDPLPIVLWLAFATPLPVVNELPLTFPRVFSTGTSFGVDRGQARYMGFERPERIAGTSLVRVVHVLDLAEHFMTEWRREDAKGNAVGPVYQDRFNRFADLRVLW